MQIAPRDFVRTPDGYLCAVLAWPLADGRIEAWPRYVADRSTGRWTKIETLAAAGAVGVRTLSPADIVQVYRSTERVEQIERMTSRERDPFEERALRFTALLTALGVPHESLGITGSALVGLHGDRSDLDITVYGRDAFAAARVAVASMVAAEIASELDEEEWHDVFVRRAPAIDFATFVKHERRKRTRVMFDEVRVDLTMVSPPGHAPAPGPREVLGRAVLDAVVLDASGAFDYPARLQFFFNVLG